MSDSTLPAARTRTIVVEPIQPDSQSLTRITALDKYVDDGLVQSFLKRKDYTLESLKQMRYKLIRIAKVWHHYFAFNLPDNGFLNRQDWFDQDAILRKTPWALLTARTSQSILDEICYGSSDLDELDLFYKGLSDDAAPQLFKTDSNGNETPTQRNLSNTYYNQTLAVIKGIAAQAQAEGLMPNERELTLINRIQSRKIHRKAKDQRVRYEADQIRMVIEHCLRDKNRLRGLRDAALFACFFGTGARRNEIGELEIHNLVDMGDHARIYIRGKGGDIRENGLFDQALQHVRTWIREAGITEGMVLRKVTKGGTVMDSLNPKSISKIVSTRAIEVLGEDQGRKLTTHKLRRGHITLARQQGEDIAVTATRVGHTDYNTTRGYDDSAEELAIQGGQKISW